MCVRVCVQVPFYQIWLLLERESPVFLKKIMTHTNWAWAVQHLLMVWGACPGGFWWLVDV